MDTKKIGAFLKQCRKEKNLTQEQFAEKFEVYARTVSRWETGINMPDLSILVQLAEYYDVEMRELLDGERSQTMNKEMKETLDKVRCPEAAALCSKARPFAPYCASSVQLRAARPAKASPSGSNGDDRRQRRKQGGAVGAAASRMQATAQQTLGAATRPCRTK